MWGLLQKKSFLSDKCKYERLLLTHKYHNWTAKDWRHVIWIDEVGFEVGKHSIYIYVWRHPCRCLKNTNRSVWHQHSSQVGFQLWFGILLQPLPNVHWNKFQQIGRLQLIFVEVVYEGAQGFIMNLPMTHQPHIDGGRLSGPRKQGFEVVERSCGHNKDGLACTISQPQFNWEHLEYVQKSSAKCL